MLICQTCHLPVVFERRGWLHRDPASECSGLAVAWPPPGESDGAEDAA